MIPAGAVTVAVFERLPVAVENVVTLTVYTAVPPTARFTSSLMLPVPLGLPLPPVNTAVHDTPLTCAGNTSLTRAPVTGFGPLLVTVIRHVSGSPGV